MLEQIPCDKTVCIYFRIFPMSLVPYYLPILAIKIHTFLPPFRMPKNQLGG